MSPVQVPKYQCIIVDRPQVACQEALFFQLHVTQSCAQLSGGYPSLDIVLWRWNLTTTSTWSWNFWRHLLMIYRLQVISRTDHKISFVDKGLQSLQLFVMGTISQIYIAVNSWCSMHYKLNPWSEPALHQAFSKAAAVN